VSESLEVSEGVLFFRLGTIVIIIIIIIIIIITLIIGI
jgi:hypothetical protein